LGRRVLVVVAICCCVFAGCFQWTEDQQGNLQSVGVPGLPLWKSSKPPAPINLTDMGYTPEEAAKVSGPVLVLPPDQSIISYRYKYYPTGHNNCQEDLQKLLAKRAASNASGDPPYCTDTPVAPPAKGNAFVF
jgi:hypothetical protein